MGVGKRSDNREKGMQQNRKSKFSEFRPTYSQQYDKKGLVGHFHFDVPAAEPSAKCKQACVNSRASACHLPITPNDEGNIPWKLSLIHLECGRFIYTRRVYLQKRFIQEKEK